MRIRRLRAQGWRNLAPFDLAPQGRQIVLWGDNGQGKTNVIEAIYFLASGRSFRTSDNQVLVQHGGQSARLQAEVETGPLVRHLEVEIADGRRRVTIDGKPARGAAVVFGALPAVLFVPEHLTLVRAAPAARRRLLDLVVFAVDRAHWRDAATYQRVLRNRNALLRSGRADAALCETYDEALAASGARVVLGRRRVATALGVRIAPLFASMHGPLGAGLDYVSDPAVNEALDEGALRATLLAGLASRRRRDESRRTTSFGPHTDDLVLTLAGRPAREHASQGQTRSLVLALKLAELDLLTERLGEAPVLLLDDVASELDPTRVSYLTDNIDKNTCQTWLSTTDAASKKTSPQRQDVHVIAGEIS